MRPNRLFHDINEPSSICIFIRKLDNSLCTSLIIRFKRILNIDTHKNVIRYYIQHELHYVNKCKQPDFLANGADLIDRRET